MFAFININTCVRRIGFSLLYSTVALGTAACHGQGFEELPPAQASNPSAPLAGNTEIVRERHSDGQVAVERHVTLDKEQNFVNHGPYTSFDETGAKVSSGQYRMGERHGLWTRWHRGHDVPLLQEPPYAACRPPFVSQASFRNGKLHGEWVIYAGSQKISEVNFVDGKRSGPAVWWYQTGGKMRELVFADNLLHGSATFYRPSGQVARTETYDDGHRIEKLKQKTPEGQLYCEGTYRHPKIVMVEKDSWTDSSFATFEMQGSGVKEGAWTVYYPNGQKQMVGAYKNDKPVGEFTWWHSTGQRASVGRFVQGKKTGEWTWWHANGMKMSRGHFREDSPHGQWASWDADGNLEQELSAIHGEEAIASNDGAEELPTPDPADNNATRPENEEPRTFFLPAKLQADPDLETIE